MAIRRHFKANLQYVSFYDFIILFSFLFFALSVRNRDIIVLFVRHKMSKFAFRVCSTNVYLKHSEIFKHMCKNDIFIQNVMKRILC